MAFFSLPLFFFTADTPWTRKTRTQGIRDGFKQLANSIREIRQYKHVVRFLIAHLLYVDGLATVFAFGGVYAAGTFDMDEMAILIFAITLNFSADIGAFCFSWIDDRIGSQRTILIALTGLMTSGTAMLTVTSVTLFWTAGLVLGLFVGPAQSSSRAYPARAAPPLLQNQMFGLFAFSGKATAFAGPLLVGWVTFLTGRQRLGMTTIVIFFAIGFTLMLSLPRADSPSSKEIEGR